MDSALVFRLDATSGPDATLSSSSEEETTGSTRKHMCILCFLWFLLVSISSDLIPGTFPTPEKLEAAGLNELPQVQLQRIPICLRQCQRIGQSKAPMLPYKLEQLFIECRK